MKKKLSQTDILKRELLKLKNDFGPDEIFTALTSIANDNDYLKTEVISYLNIIHGLNVVKIDGLNSQMEFEKAMHQLIPYHNDQQENLFLSY